MRVQLLSGILFLCCSCVSNSQEQHSALTQAIDSVHSDTISLLFIGDLMQHMEQINAAKKEGGYDYSECFSEVQGEIGRADLTIGNLEVTLAGKPYAGYPSFSAPDEFLYSIKQAGFDILTTANNHCLDRGTRGLIRTNRMLDSLQILRVGAYRDSTERNSCYPLLVEKKGFRIAFLSYTELTNGITAKYPTVVNYMDKKLVQADIEKAKKLSPDVIIAFMHWGEEYKSLPGNKQKQWVDWLIKQGVTHVIGSHPHVVQPLELRRDSLTQIQHLVVYSLGNYISNMSQRGTDGGLMVRLALEKDSTVRLNQSSYSLVWTLRPVLSGKKNYKVIPVDEYPRDSLSPDAAYRMDQFATDTRDLMIKHFGGVEEETEKALERIY